MEATRARLKVIPEESAMRKGRDGRLLASQGGESGARIVSVALARPSLSTVIVYDEINRRGPISGMTGSGGSGGMGCLVIAASPGGERKPDSLRKSGLPCTRT